MRDCRPVGPLAACFHIRKLIAQRRNAAFAKPRSKRLHEGMVHPRARPVGEDKTCARLRRMDKKRGNRIRTPDLDVKLLRADGLHLF